MAAPSPFEWQPSTFGLIRRSKYLKRAGLHGIYVLIGMTFWLVSAALFEEWTSGDTVGFALFVGFFLFWFAWNATAGSREVKDWQRLMSAGRAAHGTVSLVEQKREAWGRWTWKPGWVVSYRYIDQRGRSRIGDSGYLSRREAERWRSGDECVILYDPEAPDKTVWIGHPPAH